MNVARPSENALLTNVTDIAMKPGIINNPFNTMIDCDDPYRGGGSLFSPLWAFIIASPMIFFILSSPVSYISFIISYVHVMRGVVGEE